MKYETVWLSLEQMSKIEIELLSLDTLIIFLKTMN